LKKETIQHPVLGEITVNRSARARRLSLSVGPKGVVLTFPPRFPLAEALAFAESRREWLETMKSRAAERQAPARLPILPPFATRGHRLELTAAANTAIRLRIGGGVIAVAFPPTQSPDSDPVQQAGRQGIAEACRIEAKQLLPPRVDELARAHGFRYGGLTVRDTVSRWGSCSARNTLSLSLHLMALPDRLIDYVILHELCHTVHKNHGPGFHALLDRVTDGQHAALRRELRTHTIRR
jgi:predicted metal-dependent hydrolase